MLFIIVDGVLTFNAFVNRTEREREKEKINF